MLSNVEFHPECVRNSPVDGCDRTSSCGHQLRNIPLSFVSSKNSSGSTAFSPVTRSGRMTHRNGRPQLAKPHANSASCPGVITVMLPKLTYTTEPGRRASSHWRQLASSFQRLPAIAAVSGRATMVFTNVTSGPMVYTRGKMRRRASTTSCSSSSNVLTMIPCAWSAFCASPPSKWTMKSSGSVVRMKLGMSRRRMPGIPGTQSSTVSSRSLNGAAAFRDRDSQSAGMSCVTSSSPDGGRPSGMASKRKSSSPAMASAPRDRSRRRWLYSELT
nr:unnamed protein product [Digitaria exilis]CAB3504518.1 unnamed protein product [Digitaria exilis]